jgi:hypothetical protein
MQRRRTCWPRSSGWTGRITVRSPVTARSPSTSRSLPAPHQTMIWSRVRQVNALRSLLREYYPAALVAFGADLASRDALAVLTAAPSPERGRTAATIRAALTSQQLSARPGVVPAYAASAAALLAVLTTVVAQTEMLAGQVEQGFWPAPGR